MTLCWDNSGRCFKRLKNFPLWIFFILILFPLQINAKAISNENQVTWQAKSTIPTAEQLIVLFNLQNEENVEVDDSNVDYSHIGEYPIIFTLENGDVERHFLTLEKDSSIEASEKLNWQIEVNTKTLITDEEATDFYRKNTQSTNTSVKVINNSINLNKIGEEKLPIEITDEYGRQLKSAIRLTIIDSKAPIIHLSTTKLQYELFDSISVERIKQDLTVTIEDNYDVDLKPIIDISNVDSSAEGQYQVVISAKDSSGNYSSKKYMSIAIIEKTQLKESIQYEIFSSITMNDFIADLQSNSIKKADMSMIDFKQLGHYNAILLLNNDEEKWIDVEIIDSTSPIIITQKKSVLNQTNEKLSELQIKNQLKLDVSDNFDQNPNVKISQQSINGQEEVLILAQDASGNTSEKRVPIEKQEVNVSDSSWTYEKKDTNHEMFEPVTIIPNKKLENKIDKSVPVTTINEKIKSTKLKTSGFAFPSIILPIMFLLCIAMWILFRQRRKLEKIPNRRSRRRI